VLADHSGKMHDGVDILYRCRDRSGVANVAVYQFESLMTMERKQSLATIDRLV